MDKETERLIELDVARSRRNMDEHIKAEQRRKEQKLDAQRREQFSWNFMLAQAKIYPHIQKVRQEANQIYTAIKQPTSNNKQQRRI